jgi:hypothetical protein
MPKCFDRAVVEHQEVEPVFRRRHPGRRKAAIRTGLPKNQAFSSALSEATFMDEPITL